MIQDKELIYIRLGEYGHIEKPLLVQSSMLVVRFLPSIC
jgi:hypothetical protein